MSVLSLDVESRSAIDLKKAGAHRYWADPSTTLLCAAWAIDDGPIHAWRPGQPCPPEIAAHVRAGGVVAAHNAAFERLAWRHALGPVHGWPEPALEQFECTAAAAAAMALPRDLAGAAKALSLPIEKDYDGNRLMLQMSKPRAARKGEDRDVLHWHDDEARIARLVAYCVTDVEVERAIRRKVVPLSDLERAVYHFDQRVNDRGVTIDLPLVRALLQVVDQAKKRLDKEMKDVTGGAVTACSQASALTAWLRARGVDAEGVAKHVVGEMLASDLPPDVRRALEIRQEAAKSSTAKLVAMLNCTEGAWTSAVPDAHEIRRGDGRARGLHLYHAASTGRWGGRLIQTQNMPRGTGTVKDPERARPTMLRGSAELVEMLYGQPMSAASDMLRSCLRASPGRRLLAADYSAIEGRVTAWLADETWKVRAFEANDEGRGAGIYELTAAEIIGKRPQDVTKDERQAYGKVPELALGFGGGVVAFDSMAKIYRVDMADAYESLRSTCDAETWERAAARYDECLKRGDTGTDTMSRRAWVASEVTKVLWRAKHPATVALWRGLEDAASEAVAAPGSIVDYGRIRYLVTNGFLWCRLPSGRCLAYGAPKIEQRDTPWGDKKPAVTALGVDGITRQYRRFALYGGLATENCLGKTTEVLTQRGWVSILSVDKPDKVWDGVEWVETDGLLSQGSRLTMDFAGLRMTPDHKVLVSSGWVAAEVADEEDAYGQAVEPSRPDFRSADGAGAGRVGGGQDALARRLLVRSDDERGRVGADAGAGRELRLPEPGSDIAQGEDPRHVEAPGLRGVAQHDRPLRPADAPGVPPLRRPGHPGLRAVDAVPGVLGGHGADLPIGSDAGAAGQRRGVLAGELRLAGPAGAGAQHAGQPDDRHAPGSDAVVRRRRGQRDRQDDVALPLPGGLAGRADVRPAGGDEPGLTEPVYDLLNCGPRRRFMARGPGGRPVIVSNCVQAIARDLLAAGMLAAEAAGYEIVLHIHDDAVADVPEGFGSLGEYERLLCTKPAWAEGLPLTAAGYEAMAFKKD